VKQFLLKEDPDKDSLVRIRGKEYHYLIHVRRLRPGAVFNALLPGFPARPVSITVCSIDNQTLTGSVKSKISKPLGQLKGKFSRGSETPVIVLFQALPKGTRMDLIIRQAVELEINEVVPFISEFSVQKKVSRDKRLDRWQRIVKEARQQSGSLVDTRVRSILSADEMFAYWKELCAGIPSKALGLVFSPSAMDGGEDNASGGVFAKQKLQSSKSAGMQILSDPLAQGSFHRYLYKKPPLVALAVGPEGGFSGFELKCFSDAGFKSLSLGSSIMRTETAALFIAAAVKTILKEGTLWNLNQQ
jgi:16S rRNA (uracil1498-N3)-methyltransferase